MSELNELVKKFGTSKPVFILKSTDDGRQLEFELKERYNPNDAIVDEDPVMHCLALDYRENLNKTKTGFEVSIDIGHTYQNIMGCVREFVIQNSPLKNPKQSRLYKWLCEEKQSLYNNPSSEGFIALYRYIVNYKLNIARSDNDPYVNNVLAILELIREKYEDKKSPNK